MAELDPFQMQRELLTIEQLLFKIRDSFLGYSAGEETAEVKNMDSITRKVRTLQLQMRSYFAPDK